MIRPDDTGQPFVARWHSFCRSLLVESSVKLVARTLSDYADFKTGANCRPGNARLARDTGYNKRTVLTAMATLRGIGVIDLTAKGIPNKRADTYRLVIPEHWKRIPLLGPNGQAFTCLFCSAEFNPVGNSTVTKTGQVSFELETMCFCPPPRKNKGRAEPSCLALWDEERAQQGMPTWNHSGQERWEWFDKARSDEW
ncbi:MULTISPECIES: hypothetical protein [unclassified Nocardiopsis]|uniref:hypothetical protein n=1 Tax=Nocardiopsis TaxID=2013 RepID=UPI00387B3D3B